MAPDASGNLSANANLQYICALIFGKSLCQFDNLCGPVVSITMTHLNQVVLVLSTYFPVNELSKKSRTTYCGMRFSARVKNKTLHCSSGWS